MYDDFIISSVKSLLLPTVLYNLLLFTVRDLISGSNIAFFPVDVTLIIVSAYEYPAPGLIIITSTILLLLNIGFKIAPEPDPLTSMLGSE